MSGPLNSFRRRRSAGQFILLWLEYFFLLLGVVILGCFVWVHAATLAFQAYQSWRLDRLQQGKPASVARFVEQWLPWEKDAAEPKKRVAPNRPNVLLDLHDGTVIGRLQIPRLGISSIVMEGVSTRTLQFAVGHVPGTPLPGQPGNVSLSAHRDTFFRNLRKIQPGDVITVSMRTGDVYRYRVGAIRVVSPGNVKILDAYSGPGLNLITCFPFYYVGPAPERFIVHADENAEPVVSQTSNPASAQNPPVSLNQATSN